MNFKQIQSAQPDRKITGVVCIMHYEHECEFE